MAVTRQISFKKITNLNVSYRLPMIKRLYSTPNDDPKIPENMCKIKMASYQKGFGVPAGKKPFRTRLEAGKLYKWCTCGYSHDQPFCDKTHKNIFMKITMVPVPFKVAETKDYWLCTCKQTANRPFCDGAHKKPEIQEKKFV